MFYVERLGRTYRQHHPYPENIFWLIEYSHSCLGKDLGIKAEIYAKAGIPEYWVVNLKKMELVVWRSPFPSGYQSCTTLIEGTITPLAFQDTVIEVGRLLNP